MRRIRSRTICLMSTYPVVVTSPATTTRPVVSSVSTATRLWASCRIISSRTESLIWSAILSGCPSVTDSEVNRRPVTCRCSWFGWAMVVMCGRWSILQPEGHFVPNDVGERGLGPERYVVRGAVAGQDHGLVVARPEDRATADVVDHEEVAALAGELGPGQVEHGARVVAGLGSEADHDLAGTQPVVGEPGQDVGGLGQLDGRRGAVWRLLDLRLAGGHRTEVGGRRRHHDRVGGDGRGAHGVAELLGGLDAHHLHPGRVGKSDVGGHEGDLGSTGGCRAGQRDPLTTRGAVAEV